MSRSALPQHDDRVTCLSCRFSYPGIRGFCPMCGTPAPAPDEALPGPRSVEGKATGETNATHTRGLSTSVKQLVRRPLFVAAALLAVACGLFFLRAHSAPTSDAIAPAPAIAAAPPELTPPSASAPEKVAERPKPVSRGTTVPAPHAATPVSTADDPAELWKRVGKGDTDAEVTLARLYLDGNRVTQNCEQARLLLLAAVKRRNPAADQVLSNLYPQRCR